MRWWNPRAGLVGVALLGLLAAAGCGESGGAAKSGPAGAGPINVTLAEWSMKPNATSAEAGKVTFVVTNKGATPHELAIAKTDLAPAKVPVALGLVDEKVVVPLGRTASLDAGKSETKAFDLQPGKYLLLCNLPAHYGQGMRTTFTVTE